jgi:hypothetical protein
MDDGADSPALLNKLVTAFGRRPEYILVRNYGRGTDFSHMESSDTLPLTDEIKAKVMDLPALHPPTMRKIDHISASFWAAANNTDKAIGPTLGLMERQRVRTWLNRTYGELDRVSAS